MSDNNNLKNTCPKILWPAIRRYAKTCDNESIAAFHYEKTRVIVADFQRTIAELSSSLEQSKKDNKKLGIEAAKKADNFYGERMDKAEQRIKDLEAGIKFIDETAKVWQWGYDGDCGLPLVISSAVESLITDNGDFNG